MPLCHGQMGLVYGPCEKYSFSTHQIYYESFKSNRTGFIVSFMDNNFGGAHNYAKRRVLDHVQRQIYHQYLGNGMICCW